MSSEKFGYKNLTKTKNDGKIVAFFNLLIPTNIVGTIEVAGFKIVNGQKGHFISIPNVSKKSVKKSVDISTGTVTNTEDSVKYYNTLRFDSTERYKEFLNQINKELLPEMLSKI